MLFGKRKKNKHQQEGVYDESNIDSNMSNDSDNNNNESSCRELDHPEIDSVKSTEYKEEFYNFLKKHGFFIKVMDDDDTAPNHWRIGPLGKLIRHNVLRWWWSSLIQRLSNIVGIEEINNDENLFKQYRTFAQLNHLSLPFGINRVKKIPRIPFKSSEFILTKDLSRQFCLEFFVHPNSSESWLHTWNDYLLEHITQIGLNPNKLCITHEKRENSVRTISETFFNERYIYEYKFPFGNEKIASISNNIDFDFEMIKDMSEAERLKIKDKRVDEAYFPHILKLQISVEKLVLAFIYDKYKNIKFQDENNISILLSPKLAPIKCGIFPESSEFAVVDMGRSLQKLLNSKYKIVFESKGSVGDRINHFREFGVPFFVTINSKSQKTNKMQLFDVAKEEWFDLSENDIMDYLAEQI